MVNQYINYGIALRVIVRYRVDLYGMRFHDLVSQGIVWCSYGVTRMAFHSLACTGLLAFEGIA